MSEVRKIGRKSAKIAVRKGAADKAKAQIYARALKDVFMASKSGGDDINSNFLLKVAVERAKKFNVPKDNIEKAINKGQGGNEEGYQDISYEGHGPEGVAIFVEASTNNVTRTAGNVRSYFKKCNGSLGVSGSLEFIFERKSMFLISSEGIDIDELTLELIDAGVEEVEKVDEGLELLGSVESFGKIQNKLQDMEITPREASLIRIPLSFKSPSEEASEQIEKLIGLLEDDDDVITVYHNIEEQG